MAVWIYAVTIFLSAALLFSVQPMFAKMALPLLGGTSAVWITCVCFFQAMLLLGYAYAHFITRFLGKRRQALLHLLVVSLALVALPIAVPDDWTSPTSTSPVMWLLALLAVSVGGPFFSVSATTPLLQHWFAQTSHPSADDPYFLYSSSNLGSMLALLGYPILIEPNLRLGQQSRVWSVAYLALIALLCACSVLLWRSVRAPKASSPDKSRPRAGQSRSKSRTASELSDVVDWRRRWRWVGLSFVPSSWMLGVTTYLTTDIAPMPFLWVIPLSLYLLTFILVFARKPLIPHAWMIRIFPFAMLVLAVYVIFAVVWQTLLLHLAVFFVASMVCHGALVRDRPATSRLTEFYFWISAGGVLGGVFNALVAPVVFTRPFEYPLTVLLACLLCRSFYPAGVEAANRRIDLAFLALLALLVAAFRTRADFVGTHLLIGLVLAGIPSLFVLYVLDRTRWFAALLGLLLFAQQIEPPFDAEVLFNGRSFFGIHRVLYELEGANRLVHGTTAHGIQSRDPNLRCQPLAYYTRSGPLGQVFELSQRSGNKEPVAVIGLGAGAAICYQQPGQEFTFYEIDPIVIQMAESPQYFSYLSDCSTGRYRIVAGDGRQQLAKAEEKHYGMIMLDAFSSDAIPLHMLTREALDMYLAKLKDDGILVFHITNTHLDLKPVLANLAADRNLLCLVSDDLVISEPDLKAGKMGSTYAVLARRRAHVNDLIERPNWTIATPTPKQAVWTDDFSNVVGILKWWPTAPQAVVTPSP